MIKCENCPMKFTQQNNSRISLTDPTSCANVIRDECCPNWSTISTTSQQKAHFHLIPGDPTVSFPLYVLMPGVLLHQMFGLCICVAHGENCRQQQAYNTSVNILSTQLVIENAPTLQTALLHHLTHNHGCDPLVGHSPESEEPGTCRKTVPYLFDYSVLFPKKKKKRSRDGKVIRTLKCTELEISP